MAIQGTATWPGVQQVKRCSFTRSLGVIPSRAIMHIVPQPNNFATDGTLSFLWGGDPIVSFTNCHVDYTTLKINKYGQVVSLHVLDRRWKWRFGTIYLQANRRYPDGTLSSAQDTSPQQLAAWLLQAMGETVFDVGALPNDDRPEVKWDGEPPAVLLSRLCRERGCDISLDGPGETVRIVRLGQGALLSTDELTSIDFGINVAEAPSRIFCNTAPALFQSKIKMEAVYVDKQGNMGSIDQYDNDVNVNAAVTAVTGGKIEDLDRFLSIADEDDRKAVEKSLFRWYIAKEVGGTWTVTASDNPQGFSTSFTVNDVSQILPLKEYTVETFTHFDGTLRPRRAYCSGAFNYGGDPPDPNLQSTTDGGVVIPYDFSMDKDRGLIKFEDPVFRLATQSSVLGAYLPAQVYLTTSYHIRHPQTGSFARGGIGQDYPNRPTTPPDVFERRDLVPTAKFNYGPGDTELNVSGVTTNDTEWQPELAKAINSRNLLYGANRSYYAEYRGILLVPTDGAIRQVTYEVSDQTGAFTKVSYNNEYSRGGLSYSRRRAIESDRFDESTYHRRQMSHARREDSLE